VALRIPLHAYCVALPGPTELSGKVGRTRRESPDLPYSAEVHGEHELGRTRAAQTRLPPAGYEGSRQVNGGLGARGSGAQIPRAEEATLGRA
jgi:hypothetical protein